MQGESDIISFKVDQVGVKLNLLNPGMDLILICASKPLTRWLSSAFQYLYFLEWPSVGRCVYLISAGALQHSYNRIPLSQFQTWFSRGGELIEHQENPLVIHTSRSSPCCSEYLPHSIKSGAWEWIDVASTWSYELIKSRLLFPNNAL